MDESEPPVLKAYLPEDHITRKEELELRIEAFLTVLAKEFPDAEPCLLPMGRIEDQDWHTAWRKHFRPDQVTSELLIVPAWEPVPSNKKGRVLRMDPGPAFGTGRHPTTRMCLQALEDLAAGAPFSLLDVGTGSGILAMYGVLLGASPVAAIDVDEEALRWAQWNLDLNGMKNAVQLSLKPIDEWSGPFSVVTANLVLDVILDMMPHFSGVVDYGGSLVLSGLLREQVPLVSPALAGSGFTIVSELMTDEWACIVSRRPEKGHQQKGIRP